jgi:aldehyde dehydrogenase (NAD+)
MNHTELLQSLHLDPAQLRTGSLRSHAPRDGALLGAVDPVDVAGIEHAVQQARSAFAVWRDVPAPRRGELVRLFGEELRAHKAALGELVTLECGKIRQEGLGEVQEMIDICDFAVGLSRQLYGLTIASERPGHRMLETWQPLGVVAIISAFNFPVAVWAWNAALALVCGNSILWKPSEKTPLTALACQALLDRALAKFGDAPQGLSAVLCGGRETAEALVDDVRVALVSATGSTAMGRAVGPRVAARFGRTILELGGNNAIIVTPSADLALALPAVVFGAVGTAGQRCTTTRRLFVHRSVAQVLRDKLADAYQRLPIGDPLAEGTLVGPLIDEQAYIGMQAALERARAQGAIVHGGERVAVAGCESGVYVKPAWVAMQGAADNVQEETFAPILYVFEYEDLDDAIARQNAVPQGLSSAIFTTDLRESERFLAAAGSDCGIANVNIGTSGAEIGGAFGGEKETGGGRESGSDAWKGYMRRQTATINYSSALPLAQGIRFELN